MLKTTTKAVSLCNPLLGREGRQRGKTPDVPALVPWILG